MVDFKTSYVRGQVEEFRWKEPCEWPTIGLEGDHANLKSILVGREHSSLREKDILAWIPNPKGVFMVASGYQELISQNYGGVDVSWCKNVWNKFSWPKCNCFL